MTPLAVGGSFRDPQGTVFRRDGTLYREIHSSYEPDWTLLSRSGLLGELHTEGLLVPHDDVDPDLALTPSAWKVIRPELIPFISYPWEWCFGQLKAAALLTLELERRALDRGLTLKDASAYNIQFRRCRPVLIDSLSFTRYEEGAPWAAYRQFCSHFLAPLLLISMVDPRLGLLSRPWQDGIPLDLTAALLPWRTRLRPSTSLHIHLHAATIRKHAADVLPDKRMTRRISKLGLLGLLDNLETLIRRLDFSLTAGEWWDYEETHGYGSEARAAKERLVTRLAGDSPGVVWDLGANTGRFAELVAPAAPHVVAMDQDHNAVERHWRRRLTEPANILPLVVDLTNPSPALGWGLEERESIPDRGPADLLLALALVHHLAIGNNVPLRRIAEWFARLARRAIVEWVPKDDPQTRRLLVAREDIFPGYHLQGFEAAFTSSWRLLAREPIPGTDRVLFAFERP
jgi:ribosomal protein L11 methylase PrmA